MADLTETLAHTWRRNSGAIGVALDCAYNATSDDIRRLRPNGRQIETLAQVAAALADGLWLTIDKPHVMTHGEAADNEDGLACHEPYGPRTTCERWDLEYLGTPESPSFNLGRRTAAVAATCCAARLTGIGPHGKNDMPKYRLFF